MNNKLRILHFLLGVREAYPDGWYWWMDHDLPDEMVAEGYLNRTIMDGYHWYQISELGIEQCQAEARLAAPE